MPAMPSPLRLKSKEENNITWIDRFKKIEKRDVAAVAVCLLMLGVLPAVEQIMNSGSDEGRLQEGFSSPGGGEGGGDVYEPGVGYGAPGGLPGQAGGEVITPLSQRDPTSLVMGLGGPTRTPAAGESKLRDALANAMGRSLPEATKVASMPTPNSRLSTSLANLAGGGGGSSGATSAGLRSSADILSAAKKEPGRSGERPSSYAGAIPPPGYSGVAKRGLSSTTGDGEKLKAAADKAAGSFNRASAIDGLGEAAKASPAISGGDLSGPGNAALSNDDSAKKGGPGPNTSKGDRSFGTSLDQQKDQARFTKELEWCWEKKKALSGSLGAGLIGSIGGMTKNSGNFFSNAADGFSSAFSGNCDDIPDWLMGPLGKTLTEAIDKTLVSGPINTWAGKAGDWLSGKGGDKEDSCIFFNVDGQKDIVSYKVARGNCKSEKDVDLASCRSDGMAQFCDKSTGWHDYKGSYSCRGPLTPCASDSKTQKEKDVDTDKQAITRTPDIGVKQVSKANEDSCVKAASDPSAGAQAKACCGRVKSDNDLRQQGKLNFEDMKKKANELSGAAEKLRGDALVPTAILCHHFWYKYYERTLLPAASRPYQKKDLNDEGVFEVGCAKEVAGNFLTGQTGAGMTWQMVKTQKPITITTNEFLTKVAADYPEECGRGREVLADFLKKVNEKDKESAHYGTLAAQCDGTLSKLDTTPNFDTQCRNLGQNLDLLVLPQQAADEVKKDCGIK